MLKNLVGAGWVFKVEDISRVNWNWWEKRITVAAMAPSYFPSGSLADSPTPISLFEGGSPILTLRPHQKAATPADRVSPLAGETPGERESERL